MFVWRQPHPRAKRAGRRGSGGWYPMDPLAGERENARRHVFDTRARGETAQAELHFDEEKSRQRTIGRRGPNSQPAQCKERVVAGRLRAAASRPAGGPFRLKRTDVPSHYSPQYGPPFYRRKDADSVLAVCAMRHSPKTSQRA